MPMTDHFIQEHQSISRMHILFHFNNIYKKNQDLEHAVRISNVIISLLANVIIS